MKFALKIALVLSAAALTAAPAAYAMQNEPKKEKKAKQKKGSEAVVAAPKLNLSKGFIAAYSPVVGLVEVKKEKGKENAPLTEAEIAKQKQGAPTAKAEFPKVQAAIVSDDDRYAAGRLAVNIGALLQDMPFAAQGFDMLIASAFTPLAEKVDFTFRRGAIAYDAKQFADAEKFMTDAYNLGHRGNNIEFLISTAQSQQGRDKEASVWLTKAIDASRAAGQVNKTYVIRAATLSAKAKDYAGAANWYRELLKTENNPDYWHDTLAYFDRSMNFNPEESLDLMRLMRLTESLRFQQEYGAYLDSLSYIGVRYPAEAVAVLDEGFAKGVISKSNVTYGERYAEAKARLAEDTATLKGTEGPAKTPNAKPILASLTGDSFFSHKNYQTAKELYETALGKGPVLDKDGRDQTERTRFRLAMSKTMLGDYAGAKTDFAMVTGANRKAIADYWLMYIDTKSGATAAPAAS